MTINNFIHILYNTKTGKKPDVDDIVEKYKDNKLVSIKCESCETYEGFYMGSIYIECDSSIGSRILEVLERRGVRPSSVREEIKYSKIELDNAELLGMTLDLHPSAEYAVLPEFDTSVAGACPACKAGAPLAGNPVLVLDRRAIKNSINVMYCATFFADAHVRDALVGAGVDTGDFVRARCTLQGKFVDDRYILRPLRTLPKLHESTRGLTRSGGRLDKPCPRCDRDGYSQSLSLINQFALERRLVAPLLRSTADRAALFFTWEHFGAGPHPDRPEMLLPATPFLVLNQRARRALMSVSKAKFVWWPINLVE